MAKDIGEEIVGAWLREVAECDFVQYNVPLSKQGELDVVGLNLKTQPQTVFICEVATHTGGLQYVNQKDGQTNNAGKLVQKFDNAIAYTQQFLKEFRPIFMFWSPIIKLTVKKDAKNNAFRDLAMLQQHIAKQHGDKIRIDLIINENYLAKLVELKEKAKHVTRASEFPVFRLLQIFETLDKHVGNLKDISSQVKIQEELSRLISEPLE